MSPLICAAIQASSERRKLPISVPSPIDIERATVNAAVATAVRPRERRMNPDAIFPGRPPARGQQRLEGRPEQQQGLRRCSRVMPMRTPKEPAIPARPPPPGRARTTGLAAASAHPASAAARALLRSPGPGLAAPSNCTGAVRARDTRGTSPPSNPAARPRAPPATGIHHDQAGGAGRRKKYSELIVPPTVPVSSAGQQRTRARRRAPRRRRRAAGSPAQKAAAISPRPAPRLRRTPASWRRLTTANIAVL